VISTEGDVTIPAGEHADAVIVVNGTARIAGDVNTVVAVDGAIELTGARAATVMSVRSPVNVGADTVITGDILTIDALVQQVGNAQVRGQVKDVAAALVGVSAILIPALILIWIGFAIATLVAALLLAGLAARQVRAAETIISREPIPAFLVGVLGIVLIPAVAVALMVTLVGAPLGVAILIGLLPTVAFVGYLVAAIWVGEWILRQSQPDQPRERPYLAATIGILVLGVVGLVPVVNLLAAVASLVGFGALLMLAWRTLRGSPNAAKALAGPVTVPLAN
jgi:hypothetical protein